MGKFLYYAVHLPERHRGVYTEWAQCEIRVKGQSNKHKGFDSRHAADCFALHGPRSEFNHTRSTVHAWTYVRSLPVYVPQPLIEEDKTSVKGGEEEEPPTEDEEEMPVKKENETLPDQLENVGGEKLEDFNLTKGFAKYYAVSLGRKVGI